MDELEDYRSELAEVVAQLRDAPDDQELLDLKDELQEMIGILEKEAKPLTVDPSPPPPPAPKPEEATTTTMAMDTSRFKAGDRVLVRYQREWCEAKVTAITGARGLRKYTVYLTAQRTVETVDELDVREPRKEQMKKPAAIKQFKKDDRESSTDKAAPKNNGNQKSKAQILNESQAKWKQFQKQGVKLGKGKRIGTSTVLGSASISKQQPRKPQRSRF